MRVWLILKFFLNSRYRSEKITRIRYPNEMIQTSAATTMNRYPQLFEIAAKELKDIPYPKILSFGCSTGEEVFSLKKYIPTANIVGVDINHQALSIAKKKNQRGAFQFFHYRNDNWKVEAPYDCILALAVFQKSELRNPDQKTSVDTFNFSKFEKMIGQLHTLLKPGGLLVIDHSDYSFQDLPISKKYSVSENDLIITRERPVLSKGNIIDSLSNDSHRIFIKGSQ